MLLDDVMSELDGDRRHALVDLLRSAPGQSVITTTDVDHVPGAGDDGVMRLAATDGRVLEEALVP
jgi:recombinational DNA repair ATPase RecF